MNLNISSSFKQQTPNFKGMFRIKKPVFTETQLKTLQTINEAPFEKRIFFTDVPLIITSSTNDKKMKEWLIKKKIPNEAITGIQDKDIDTTIKELQWFSNKK